MRPRLLQALLATGALAATALVVWPGCAFVDLPESRKPVPGRKPADVQFVRQSLPTRTEVLRRLGPPDAEFINPSITCYRLNKVKHRELWMLFGILPIAAPASSVGTDLGLLQYDSEDRVKRFAVLTNQIGGTIQYQVVHQWVEQHWATNTTAGPTR